MSFDQFFYSYGMFLASLVVVWLTLKKVESWNANMILCSTKQIRWLIFYFIWCSLGFWIMCWKQIRSHMIPTLFNEFMRPVVWRGHVKTTFANLSCLIKKAVTLDRFASTWLKHTSQASEIFNNAVELAFKVGNHINFTMIMVWVRKKHKPWI